MKKSLLMIAMMLVFAITLAGCATTRDLEKVQAEGQQSNAKAEQALKEAQEAKAAAEEATNKAAEAAIRAENAAKMAGFEDPAIFFMIRTRRRTSEYHFIPSDGIGHRRSFPFLQLRPSDHPKNILTTYLPVGSIQENKAD